MTRWLPLLALTAVLQPSFASAQAAQGVTEKEIVIGVANPIEGKVTSGIPINAGFKAALERLNAGQGIHGRKIRIVHCDDNYSPEKTFACTKKLSTEDKVFALTGYNGTATIKAAHPFMSKGEVPFLFGRTGDQFLREPFNKMIFNMRPSFGDEIEVIVKAMLDRGFKKFAMLRQSDAYGDSMKSGLVAALGKFGLLGGGKAPLVSEAMAPRENWDTAQLFATIDAGAPEVVIIATAPPAAADLIKYAASKNKKWVFAGVNNANGTVPLVGDTPIEIVLSQVVPQPDGSDPIAAEFREDIKKSGGEKDMSHISFESYINMRIIGEALKRAGAKPTRDSFITALEGSPFDMGGYSIDWSATDHNGRAKIYLSRAKNKKLVPY